MLRRIKDNIDIVGVIVVVLSAVALLIYVSQPIYYVIGGLLLLSGIAYLFIRKKGWSIKHDDDKLHTYIYDIYFFIIYVASLVIYVTRGDEYSRPLAYYILTALACGILAYKIFRATFTKWGKRLAILEIIAIGLSVEWTVTLLYPSIIGLDPYLHLQITERIVNGEWYYLGGMPVFHYIVAWTQNITGFDYKIATMVSISLIQVVADVVIIYLVGKLLTNYKVGLLAALLLVTANWHIFFGFWTIPNVLGATLVLLIMYLVIRYRHLEWHRYIVISLIPFIVLLFTHPIATVWAVIAICVYCIVAYLYKLVYQYNDIKLWSTIAIFTVFVTGLLLWWGIGSSFLSQLVYLYDMDFNPGILQLTTAPNSIELISAINITTPVIETISSYPVEFIFNSVAMFIYFAAAIMGCLYMVSKKMINSMSIYWAITGIIILIGGFIPMLLGFSVVEHRWWYMAEMILAAPLAVACFLVNDNSKRYIVPVFITCLVFMMMIGLPANMDNRTISQNQIIRYAFTDSELEALSDISREYNGRIGVDEYYTLASQLVEIDEYDTVINISPNIYNRDFVNCDADVVLIRNEMVYGVSGAGYGSIYKLLYHPSEVMAESGYTLIYSNDGVNAYARFD